jgi:hypothetical protein
MASIASGFGPMKAMPSAFSRRAKIDVHEIPADVLDAASLGATIGVALPGRARDGGPACATVRPLGPWIVVSR